MEPVHFLLVDDLEENLLALEGLLQWEGLELLKARSGADALELLLRHDVALALVDVQMPGMDGFELAEYMRGSQRTSAVPIIFLTAGSADRQRRFRGYEAGAVDFLQKPIEPHILQSKAQVFFDLYRQRREVARQRDELEAAMQDNARLLAESRQYAEALKDADRRKDEFLATLAHELRNPLAPIRNGLQILSLQEDAGPDETRPVRDMMDRQLNHLVRLIDDLLDMSRISKGKIELRLEKVKLQTVIDFAVEASQPQIEAGRHRLVRQVPEEELWLDADLNRLTQVVSNLLNNAAKYTPEGGEITLEARPRGGEVSISVSDNGIGIPPDKLQEIFELFTQVDSTQEQAKGGLGIGLALARHLVEMHGGSIEVESAGAGHGSTFSIGLPLSEGQRVRKQEGADDLADGSQGLTVLIVDDNTAAAQTTGMLLELAGHRPVLAHDGPEALERARAECPAAILLDIGLPGLSGYEVCRRLRRDPAFRDTLIIAQTGLGQRKDRDRAKDAGFDHYLVKPVNFNEIRRLLSHCGVGPSHPIDFKRLSSK